MRPWPLESQKVQDTHRELSKLAVFDKLAQMAQRGFFTLGNRLDHVEDGLDYRPLEVVTTLVAQDAREEGEHRRLLRGEFEAERTDRLDDDYFELVADFGHEPADRLHQSVHRHFVPRL